MNKFLLVLMFFACSAFQAKAQGDYSTLRSEGRIPFYLLQTTEEKFKQRLSELRTDVSLDDKGRREYVEDVLLTSNLSLDFMMRNGRVLYNDQVSNYLSKVADYAITDQSLRKRLNFHTVRSSVMNAWVPDRDLVFVHLGLLAYVETEAQLAFVLAHEAAHIQQGHVLNQIKIDHDLFIQNNRKESYDDLLLNQSMYSKKDEFEADSIGIQMILKSKYGTSSIPGLFDLFVTSSLPYERRAFDLSVLNTDLIQLPDSVFLADSLLAIDTTEQDDELSTHPAPKKRKRVMERIIAQHNWDGPKSLTGDDEFLRIQRIARHELCRLYIQNGMFHRAMYCAGLLLQDEPNSVFAQAILAKALYGLSYVSLSHYLAKPNQKHFQGEYHQVWHIVDQLFENTDQLMVLTLAKAHELYEQYPHEATFMHLRNWMLRFMVIDAKVDFKLYNNETAVDYVEKRQRNRGRIEINYLDNEEKNKNNKDYSHHKVFSQGLQNVLADSTVLQHIDSLREIRQKFDDLQAHLKSKTRKGRKQTAKKEIVQSYKELQQIDKKVNRRGKYGRMDRTVFIEPSFMLWTRNAEKLRDPLKADGLTRDLHQRMKHLSANAGLNIDILNTLDLGAGDIDRFNDLSDFKLFINSFHVPGMHAIWNPNELDAVIERYDTRIFSIGEVDHILGDPHFYFLYMAKDFPPALPMALVSSITRKNFYNFRFISFDIKSGRIKYFDNLQLYSARRNHVLDNQLYSIFAQMGRYPKKKNKK